LGPIKNSSRTFPSRPYGTV
jgi:hypothetical protein